VLESPHPLDSAALSQLQISSVTHVVLRRVNSQVPHPHARAPVDNRAGIVSIAGGSLKCVSTVDGIACEKL
jgi:hypothetical protein